MPAQLDVGDTANLTLTVEPADQTTVAAATVVAPAGGVASLLTVTSNAERTEWTALLPITALGVWQVTWTVTGVGNGVAHDTVYAFGSDGPAAGDGYATLAQFAGYLRKVPPDDFDPQSLVRASRRVDRALIGAIYDVDTDGRPTDLTIAAALRDATCAQALWWDELGDTTGSGALSEWGEVEIGQVRLRRSGNSRGEAGANSPLLCLAAEDFLRAAGLLPVHAIGSG